MFKSNLPKDWDLNKRYVPIKSESERDEISQKVKEKYKDPEFKQKHKTAMETRDHSSDAQALEKRLTNPDYLKNLRKGIEDLKNDPVRWAEYQENYQKGNTAKYDDPAYWEAYYAAIKVRDANPEYHKKRIEASKKKICKKVHTPNGIFESISEAARHYNLNPEGMRHRVKSKNYPDFYIIDEQS